MPGRCPGPGLPTPPPRNVVERAEGLIVAVINIGLTAQLGETVLEQPGVLGADRPD